MPSRPAMTARPICVEVLAFAGCPNAEAARTLVADIVGELGADVLVELVDVPDAETATRVGFLGSPTIRVNGLDVEPGAVSREPSYACRVYRTESGLSGVPEPRWIRDALERARAR